MKNRERTIYFYDTRVQAKTRSDGVDIPSCISMQEVLTLISKLDLKGRHGAFKRAETELFQIQDFYFNPAACELQLLINHADKNLADPVFKNFENRRVRNAGKEAIEGIDVSAHVLIRPSATDIHEALLLVTYGSGVTAKLIGWLLGKLMELAGGDVRNKSLFEFRHPSGEAGKFYSVKYRFECVGHKSQKLSDDLARGSLQSVELISKEPSSIDAGSSFFVSARTLNIKPVSTAHPTLGAVISAVRTVTQSTHERYDSVRVRFKDASDTQREELFAANNLEAAFVRKERLKFDTDLPSQQIRINPTIMSAMRRLCEE